MNIKSNHIRLLLLFILLSACAGTQSTTTESIDLRPLPEGEALSIIATAITQRGYEMATSVPLIVGEDTQITTDLRVLDQRIAVEYVTEQDALEIGTLPTQAPGSRLHVIPAIYPPAEPDTDTQKTDAASGSEHIYLFILKASDYHYHHNPTSQTRADITQREVQRRLTRDINDFLSWYERSTSQ